jgi:hypothetical protein
MRDPVITARNAFLRALRSVVDYRASRSARYYDLSVS